MNREKERNKKGNVSLFLTGKGLLTMKHGLSKDLHHLRSGGAKFLS